MAIKRWLYRSDICVPDAETTVSDIFAVSMPRNRSLEVTGALLFTGSRFVQYIEGPEKAIDELKGGIERDSRHTQVETLIEGGYARRLFPRWSLAAAGPLRFVAETVDNAAAAPDIGADDNARRLVSMLVELTA